MTAGSPQHPRGGCWVGKLGDSEVDERDIVMVVQQDVFRFQVPVNDRWCLRVQVGEDLAELPHPRESSRQGDLPSQLLASACQGGASSKLQDQVDHAVVAESVHDIRDGRMPQEGKKLDFSCIEKLLRDFFDCPPFPLELQVLGEVGGGKPSFPKDANDAVAVIEQFTRTFQVCDDAPDLAVGADVPVSNLGAAHRTTVLLLPQKGFIHGLAAMWAEADALVSLAFAHAHDDTLQAAPSKRPVSGFEIALTGLPA